MLRLSLLVFSRGVAKRFASSFSGQTSLPPNLMLPTNLVDPARLKRRPPPADCPLPLLRTCDAVVPAHLSPVQMWVETLQSCDSEPMGLAELHPDVFAVRPRLDILYDIEMWQRSYKRISYANTKVRSEVRGGGRKPWRQKGSGRARHGSIRSPIWRGGGVSHGPRGPNSYYYMLPMKVRVQGLKVALSSKMSQDYLHIVDSLSIPTPDPQYLLDLVRQRHWGESVLIVDIGEEFPENILRATADLKTVNLIPAIVLNNNRVLAQTNPGWTLTDINRLNVHSMLKHEVLVLTLETVKFLEEKLLWHDQRYTPLYPFKLPYSDFP